MTFAQQRNCLMTHFFERIPAVKRRMTVVSGVAKTCISFISISIFNIRVLGSFETSVITHQTAVTRRRRTESSVIKFIRSFILQSALRQTHIHPSVCPTTDPHSSLSLPYDRPTFIPQSALRQTHSPFQSQFSTDCDLVLQRSISNIVFLP